MRPIFIVLAAALMLILQDGCATAPKAQGASVVPAAGAPAATQPVASLNDLVIMRTIAPQPIDALDMDATPLLPLREGTFVYRIVKGDKAGTNLTARLRQVTLPDGATRWQREFSDGRTEYLQATADGKGMTVLAVADKEHNALTSYRPAQPLYGPALSPDQPLPAQFDLLVTNLKNPKQVIDKGSGSATLLHDANVRILTPAGAFDCYRITQTYQLKMGAAQVSGKSVSYYAPGVGTVAEEETEQVQTTMFIGWKTYRMTMAVQLPGQAPTPPATVDRG